MNVPAPATNLPVKRIPGATYRLQFNRDFTFTQAADILDYLAELGVTDIYASPLFQAGPDSTHGYDVCCFGKINSAPGVTADFERFNSRRRELGLGLLLDMVPNHMGALLSNGWWLDVLEHGPGSKFAAFFEIDWQPTNPASHNKILLPVLGDHYGKVLGRGELKLGFDAGKFFIGYGNRKFPAAVKSLPGQIDHSVMAVESILAEFNGVPGQPASFGKLHGLIQQQHYRLACWRVGPEEINYRRFFDVTELVSLRMERSEVFAASHELLFDWLRLGIVTGLRIDHPDGLRDPKQYFERLQTKATELAGISLRETVPAVRRDETCASSGQCLKPGAPLYIVAEKILSGDEALPDGWPVDGTTGYDFLNRVNGLFVNSANECAFDDIYEQFRRFKPEPTPVGEGANATSSKQPIRCSLQGSIAAAPPEQEHSESAFFKNLVAQCKRQVLETSLISELDSLTHRLQKVTANTRAGMDFTFSQLKSALKELIAAFPVYRTYLTDQALEPSTADRAVIENAIAAAQSNACALEPEVFQLLGRLLTLELIPELSPDVAAFAREFVLRFQQLTGPVMAKGLEDTAFYNFNRLISLNEVGGDPGRFGVSPEAFHNANATIAAHWPHTLLASATHDTKRGEDARARINVLSEIPGEWRAAVTRWSQWNADKKSMVNGAPAPAANDEYLLYQSLVGAFPMAIGANEVLAGFRDRVSAFMLKAIREAKANTSWLAPNTAYESAMQEFIRSVLADDPDNPFLGDLKIFTRRAAFFGRFNSLSQVLLKITSPGVPDFYQGTELWDFSFVDPDNRRAVDFSRHRRLLSEFKAKFTPSSAASLCSDLLKTSSGEIKLFVIWRALELRNRWRGVFDHGAYTPLAAFGTRRDHVCAFARTLGKLSVLAVAPRLACGLAGGGEIAPQGSAIWRDTFLPLPGARSGDAFRNAFTGETIRTTTRGGVPALILGEILNVFPVALLESAG